MESSRRLGGRRSLTGDSRGRALSKAVLLLGFVAYGLALLIAHRSPATGYELSLYAATPLAFWILAAVAVVAAVVVAVHGSPGFATTGATVLGGLSITTVVALPVVRGYFYYGSGDALTHLGWATEFAAGERAITSLVYPAGHLAAAAIAELAGLPVRHGITLLVVAVVVCYFVFVAMVARVIGVGQRAQAFAAFSAFLLLPVTNVSTHLQFHPYTLTVFLLPLAVYLLVRYVSTSVEGPPFPGGIAAETPLFAAVIVATILFHPQTALNVLILFGTIAVLQRYHRRRIPPAVAENTRSLFGVTALFAVVFAVWVVSHDVFFAMFFGLVESTVNTVGGSEAVGQQAQQRGGSLTDIGVTLTSIFLRMFLVEAVFVGLTAAVIAANLFGGLRDTNPTASTAVSYLAVGGLALTPFFLLHFMGDVSGYFFRHVGFGMAIATLVGFLGIAFLSDAVRDRRLRYAVGPAITVAIVAMLVLSVLAAFPSPFIYKANQHVTESEMTGHERAFQTSAEDVSYVGIRSGPDRFVEATPGIEPVSVDGDIPPRVVAAGNATSHYDSDRYVLVTEMDIEREVRAFDELRYSEADLERLGEHDGVHRVRSNGNVDVYYVEGDNGSADGANAAANAGSDPDASSANVDADGDGGSVSVDVGGDGGGADGDEGENGDDDGDDADDEEDGDEDDDDGDDDSDDDDGDEDDASDWRDARRAATDRVDPRPGVRLVGL